MSLLPVGIGSAEAGGYQIERSLRFNSADSAYLNRTPASASNRRTWTWSAWVKRSALGSEQMLFEAGTSSGGSSEILRVFFTSGDALEFNEFSSSAYQFRYVTTQVFRDVGSWYHLICVLDTVNSIGKVYLNGVQITAFSTSTAPALNFQGQVNSTVVHSIGRREGIGTYLNGYLTEINFIDGQALTPSSFGETDTDTGVWKPKKYTGSYGSQGWYINFSDNSGTTSTTLGKDSSGNGNNWTPNNFSVTAGITDDSFVDTPTPYGTDTGAGGEVRGNYATLNPLSPINGGIFTNGNLQFTSFTIGNAAIATIGMSSGKWYWEARTQQGSTEAQAGVYGTSASSLYSFAANATDYGFRFDADAGTLDYTTDGVSFTSLDTGLLSGPYFPYLKNNGTTNKNIYINFGQRPFAYTAPSGFKALCTQNLP